MSTLSSTSLSKFVVEQPLPSVARVVDGFYGTINVSNENELYVHSMSVQSLVIAETLVSEWSTAGPVRRPKTTAGKTLSLPLDYPGLFELMSVDGRTAQPMTSVLQLVDAFPARCLVRKTVNVLSLDDVRRGGGTRSRCVSRGELLTLVRVTGQGLLVCRDGRGADVYLPLSQRGLFSPVNQHAVSGVHTLRSLLAEFRLPIIARLVSGLLPKHVSTAYVMRLAGIQTDRITFVLPLRHAWTSTSVDRHALVPVASRHASRLIVVQAAKDFYQDWLMTGDGVELRRRCDEIVTQWTASVHLMPGVTAAAAAAAAAAATESRPNGGDSAVWSRGPIGRSLDSCLASSASAPSIACNVAADDADDIQHLEHEIDDIYEMIRYGSDGIALHTRTQSLDDCDRLALKPTLDSRGGRRPSADCVCAPTQTSIAKHRGKHLNRVVSSPSTIDKTQRCLSAPAVNLIRVAKLPENDVDEPDNSGVNVDRDSQGEATTSSHRPSESDAARCRSVDAISDDVEMCSTTPVPPLVQHRNISQSVPEIMASAAQSGDFKSNSRKSVVGVVARSIANVFRRIRLHKTSGTFNVDACPTTGVSERYSKRIYTDENRNQRYPCR